MTIIDGKKIAKDIRDDLAKKISKLPTKPTLVVYQVGDNPASNVYVRNKKRAAEEVGIHCEICKFSDTVSKEELYRCIDIDNDNPYINGIIVQLPLPKTLDENEVLNRINPDKDVDGFTNYNIGKLWANNSLWTSATPEGIIKLIKSVEPNIAGKHAVIIGRSNIVGKPTAALLLKENCAVTILHSKSQHNIDITKTADIVIVACGSTKLVNSQWLKENAIVIDVGINKVGDKLYGDVDYEDIIANSKIKAITPVPGGVGPMTIAMLLYNTYKAYNYQKYL